MRTLMAYFLIAAIVLPCFVIKHVLTLVCYDASIVQRDASAAISGPISTTSLENNCKVCLTLIVRQDLSPGVDANLYPIKMTRRTCGMAEGSSCAEGRYSCSLDQSTFERPKFILNNKPVPVLISERAEKQCLCCDSDFCNGHVPDRPIPCNVTAKIRDENMKKCIGCMVERRTTWTGQFSEVTKCLPTGCENYQNSCSSCDANDFEKCSCSCSINFPKVGYFNTSFVVPNKRQTITVPLPGSESKHGSESKPSQLGYEVSDAQARMTNNCAPLSNQLRQIFSRIVIAVIANCFFFFFFFFL